MSQLTRAPVAVAANSQRTINAVVVSAGLMQKTVKVKVGYQEWNNHIRKKFSKTAHVLVHDPRSSLRTGDIISISPGWRVSKHVHHVVSSIIAPFGSPIEERPSVPTEAERLAERQEKQRLKDERKGKAHGLERKASSAAMKEAVLAGEAVEGPVAERLRERMDGVLKAKARIEDERLEREGVEEMLAGVDELNLRGEDEVGGSAIAQAAGLKIMR